MSLAFQLVLSTLSLGLVLSLALSSTAFAADGGISRGHQTSVLQPAPDMNTDIKPVDAMPGMMQGNDMKDMEATMIDHMHQNKTFSDKAFLSAMIPHHEAAVEMANAVLKNGKDAQVKKWAEAVIVAQQSEIKQMREWLTILGGDDAKASEMMKNAMHAMMDSPMNLNPDINFVDMMIRHHASAVEMSVNAIISSHDQKIIQLASAIAGSQLNEIIQFKTWLISKRQ